MDPALALCLVFRLVAMRERGIRREVGADLTKRLSVLRAHCDRKADELNFPNPLSLIT